MHAVVIDKKAPEVLHAAPLAITPYKAGDKAYITVIYSEPINFISDTPKLSLSSRMKTYFKDPTCVSSGIGTNAMVFEVTAAKGITADEIMDINEYLVFPESKNYKNDGFGTNIGTLTATVKDYCGNSVTNQ